MPAPVLFVSAVPFELALLGPVSADPYIIKSTRLAGRPALLLASGIGPACAAGALAHALATRHVAAVVNVGLAGSYSLATHPLGSVCLVTREAFGDLGAPGVGPAGMGFPLLPSGEDRIELARPSLTGLRLPVLARPGTGLTVSSVSHTPRLAAARARRTEAAIESMEGAAFALSAVRAGVPFFEIRGISNRAGVRDKRRWKLPEAAAAAQAVARALLEAGRFP